MTKSKNTAEIKFRCKPEEKDTVNQDASAAGLSLSDYVRSILLCGKKAVFLVEGAEISKSLFLIRKDLAYFRSNGSVPQQSLDAFTISLDDVAKELNSLNKKVSATLSCNAEENSDE